MPELQDTIPQLLEQVREWAGLVSVHRETLDRLIEVGEKRRLGRVDQIRIRNLQYDDDRIWGDIVGSQGDTYTPHITLRPRRGHLCTCEDWQRNGRRVGPCKHVLALGIHARDERMEPAALHLSRQLDAIERLLQQTLGGAHFGENR